MSRAMKIIFAVVYAFYVLLVLLLATVPPVSRDALTHHLAVPKLWVEKGGIHETPDIVFSYYPQMLDLLYTIPLIFDRDIAAKYIHFSFGLLTAYIIFLFVRRRLGAAWGACAGIMFLGIPLIVKLSVNVYVDLGLIFFCAAALFAVILWLEDTSKLKWLLASAVASGLALSTKYSAMVPVFVLGVLVPFFYSRSGAGRQRDQLNAVKYAALFGLLSVLVFSPWLVRNYSLTGNPVYPLAQGIFAGEVADSGHLKTLSGDAAEAQESPRKLGPLLIRKLVYDESLPYTLMIPLRIFYEGQDDNPKYFDGRLNLLLLLLPLALVLTTRLHGFRQIEIPLFTSYVVLVVLLVFLVVDMRTRWVAAIIPPLVVLATYCLFAVRKMLVERNKSALAGNAFVAVVLITYFVPNALYAKRLYEKIEPLSYLSGELTRDQYIQKYRPEYAAIRLANTLVADDARVFGLYLGDRRYYFSVSATLDNELFIALARNAQSGDEIALRLAQARFTHMLIRTDIFNLWLGQADAATQTKVGAFVRDYLSVLEMQEGYGLYEIAQPGSEKPGNQGQ